MMGALVAGTVLSVTVTGVWAATSAATIGGVPGRVAVLLASPIPGVVPGPRCRGNRERTGTFRRGRGHLRAVPADCGPAPPVQDTERCANMSQAPATAGAVLIVTAIVVATYLTWAFLAYLTRLYRARRLPYRRARYGNTYYRRGGC